MQQRHKEKWQYFNEQAFTTKKHVIPYIGQHVELGPDSTILEIRCGEGGNLLPFVDMGCKVTGIDLSRVKIDKGNEFYASHKNLTNLTLIANNIYNRNDLG
ncbi:methyltransferase domain-containing protein [Draconibacterium halophilum]|uniref:hypothetical protein n=1 Tax=Draconibacterium halophilum TaxID=2706887 RepID=UPI00193ECE70|nr:hypothetical protein [Draconibacterium halophilum]